MNKKFYITTPIYYVNDKPHIGSAYTTIAADVLARYHRMIGDRTFFLTGTDEHGAKIEKTARKAGQEPKKFVDELAAKFELAWDELNISNDNFIRTTDKKHVSAAQKALEYLYEKKYIYKGQYTGLYCVGCEQYKTAKDLVNGKCPDHGTEPEKMKEECYMFKLSAFQSKLFDLIKKDKLLISPVERKNEVISFLEKNKLEDISASRKNVKWGITLPWDKEHTTYVWIEAFLNYLTGLGWSGENKTPSPLEGEGWGEVWPPDVQLMSKDILRVHATIWPALLLAIDLSLPKQIFVHGFFLVDGQKMSKSLGNVISPEDLIKKYGVDGARYLLMSATPFGHDGDVSWKKFDEKYNADLANGIGNLSARSITLAEKTQNSKLKTQNNNSPAARGSAEQVKFKNEVSKAWKEFIKNLNNLEIDRALFYINFQMKYLDNYITENKPWELIKKKDEKVGIIMYNILEGLRQIAWMLWPFMPQTSEKIWEQLGLDVSQELAKNFKEATQWGGLKPGTKVKKGEVLFPRI
ncbi:methionine--tRNA ligase [Candidatus Falkowbacteria bacterium CG11_big_fil_rev_8_21_14_0_20_39_10]|uniref:Methionine--tRNA ligase n=1 Tax=Candidatus Falkowbacteria bacterium CG11_big_fil_rev_8_21_14_0_20_39_10 TaxID=1974570 RepID=A0A2M6K888_9BACT|nr:MAG: methionine--tRNA ligase [Candidatus Falkowbacteria bacterium CG11_big_fil_rev_8_21_14_0_20_39_10]